jgi:hypothetical protein
MFSWCVAFNLSTNPLPEGPGYHLAGLDDNTKSLPPPTLARQILWQSNHPTTSWRVFVLYMPQAM